MSAHLQFITTPTADTNGTILLLHFDDRRYVIGQLGEGTQRAMVENSVRLGRVSDIFLTGQTTTANTGGLIGMLLTLADVNAEAATQAAIIAREKGKELQEVDRGSNMCIHGGPNIKYSLACTRRFILRKQMATKVLELSDEEGRKPSDGKPTWTDEHLKVWKMAVDPTHRNEGQSPISGRRHSNKKRSFDDIEGDSSGGTEAVALSQNISYSEHVDAGTPVSREEALDEIIDFMFNSTWSKDNYAEISLAEAPSHAQLFQRNKDTGNVEKIERSSGALATDTKVLVRLPWPASLKRWLPPTKPSAVAMSYIFSTQPRRGRFLPQKARELGVKPGPAYAKLAKGESVASEKGDVVTPDMVLEAERPGVSFAVIDLPTIDYIDALLNRCDFPEAMESDRSFIWLLGRNVLQDSRLITFMSEQKQHNHFIASPEYCSNSLTFQGSASNLIHLNMTDSERYPLPVHSNEPEKHLRELNQSEKTDVTLWQPAERGLRVNLQPVYKIRNDQVVPHLNTALVSQMMPKKVLKLARSAGNELQRIQGSTNGRLNSVKLPGAEAEIITLGTGSALPSKYRNVSATLLRVPGKGSYLFDCGEGTIGQLRRTFRPAELEELFLDLKMIWISHLHADHHLGIVSILKHWYNVTKDSTSHKDRKLAIVGHARLTEGLMELSNVEDFGLSKMNLVEATPANRQHRVDQTRLYPQEPGGKERVMSASQVKEYAQALNKEIGTSKIAVVYVPHCSGAMAISVTFDGGFKFSYSGDTRPSSDFVEIGKDSTVLVHEATFDNDLQEDAIKKKHSTIGEALGVGLAMGAKRMILTHFSQRYPKFPNVQTITNRLVLTSNEQVVDDGSPALDEEEEEGDAERVRSRPSGRRTSHETMLLSQQAKSEMKVGVAFDFMRVKVGEIEHLEHFGPALAELFKGEESSGSPSPTRQASPKMAAAA